MSKTEGAASLRAVSEGDAEPVPGDGAPPASAAGVADTGPCLCVSPVVSTSSSS